MRLLALFCAGLATFAMALGYAGQSLWAGAGICGAIGLLWLAGHWRGWDWAADPCLAGWVGMAAFGAWHKVGAGWMLGGLVAALAAWDLAHFAERLRGAGLVLQRAELTRTHLRQLASILGAGLLLGSIALGVRIDLTFGWALLIGALAIVGVSGLIRYGGGR
ncbi:MAG TPA: hypothetical protein VKE41_14490 [Roseiflexaceae bacterium]|nr:hypothetical protein [Roseiflexaceae bacterium]